MFERRHGQHGLKASSWYHDAAPLSRTTSEWPARPGGQSRPWPPRRFTFAPLCVRARMYVRRLPWAARARDTIPYKYTVGPQWRAWQELQTRTSESEQKARTRRVFLQSALLGRDPGGTRARWGTRRRRGYRLGRKPSRSAHLCRNAWTAQTLHVPRRCNKALLRKRAAFDGTCRRCGSVRKQREHGRAQVRTAGLGWMVGTADAAVPVERRDVQTALGRLAVRRAGEPDVPVLAPGGRPAVSH